MYVSVHHPEADLYWPDWVEWASDRLHLSMLCLFLGSFCSSFHFSLHHIDRKILVIWRQLQPQEHWVSISPLQGSLMNLRFSWAPCCLYSIFIKKLSCTVVCKQKMRDKLHFGVLKHKWSAEVNRGYKHMEAKYQEGCKIWRDMKPAVCLC